jgi:hypothetical protein
LAVVASRLVVYPVIVLSALTTYVAVFKVFSPRVALVKVAVRYPHLFLLLLFIIKGSFSYFLSSAPSEGLYLRSVNPKCR